MIAKVISILVLVEVVTAQDQQQTQPANLDWNWEDLRSMLVSDCQNEQQPVGSSNDFSLSQADLPALLSLSNVPFAGWLALNTSSDIQSWDTPTLKAWLQNYVLYHNAVANTQGNPQDNNNNNAGQQSENLIGSTDHEAPIVNTLGQNLQNNNNNNGDGQNLLGSPSQMNQILNFDQIWDPSFDSLPVTDVINQLQQRSSNLLYETYAFFHLLFGFNGLIRNATPDQLASAQNLQTGGRFLQAASNNLQTFQNIDQGIKNLANFIQQNGIGSLANVGVGSGLSQLDSNLAAIQAWINQQYAQQFQRDCNCTQGEQGGAATNGTDTNQGTTPVEGAVNNATDTAQNATDAAQNAVGGQ